MTEKISLLVLNSQSDDHLALLQRHYAVTYAPTPALRRSVITAQGGACRAVLTNGGTGLTATEIAAMPQLELVCAIGAGYENIALDAARARGIAVANGAGTNDDCVADHAFGLLLAAVRGIVTLDRQCRDGVWRDAIPFPPNVSGRRLGILGLGTIGEKIARRAGGFDVDIGYHNRQSKPGVAHRYFDSLIGLAEWADFLIVATPGGQGTQHLVGAAVLQALGPRGVLVNIARGSVVDTAALAVALQDGSLGAAGLDVYESEPKPPAALIGLANVVLTPHVAGWSPEAVEASVRRFLANTEGHFAGTGVVSPV